jgi:hypothetical protein
MTLKPDIEYPVEYFGLSVYLGLILIGLIGFFLNLLSINHIRKSVLAKSHFKLLLFLDSACSLCSSINMFTVSLFFILKKNRSAGKDKLG